MQYRRAFAPGGTFFLGTGSVSPRFVGATLCGCPFGGQARGPVPYIDAAVILPHQHCIWTLPPGDADFSARWRLVTTWFTKHCDADGVSGYAALTRPTGLPHWTRTRSNSSWLQYRKAPDKPGASSFDNVQYRIDQTASTSRRKAN